MVQLPPEFKSLYRLFLRTVSATVLHHPQATRNLRLLWRPSFDAAARVTNQHNDPHTDAAQRTLQKKWLKEWEQRMDNTLAMLYNSSQSRGLSHNLTRNLAHLVYAERKRLSGYKLNVWDPEHPRQLVTISAKSERKTEKRKPLERLKMSAWGPLSQVVNLAEAKDGLTLGRVVFKGWKAQLLRKRGLL